MFTNPRSKYDHRGRKLPKTRCVATPRRYSKPAPPARVKPQQDYHLSRNYREWAILFVDLRTNEEMEIRTRAKTAMQARAWFMRTTDDSPSFQIQGIIQRNPEKEIHVNGREAKRYKMSL